MPSRSLEAAGPGRLVPARPTSRAAHSARRRRVLRTPSRSRATARVRGDGLRRARTACEMDARGPSLRARFVFSFEGPTPCRAGSRRVVLTSARPSRAASRRAHGRASGLRGWMRASSRALSARSSAERSGRRCSVSRGGRVAMSDDRDAIHFPEAETIPSFAIAFMGMMFAHARSKFAANGRENRNWPTTRRKKSVKSASSLEHLHWT